MDHLKDEHLVFKDKHLNLHGKCEMFILFTKYLLLFPDTKHALI